jgi:hypothetical protein
MVGEAVEGALRPPAGNRSGIMLQGVTAAALAAFDRYPEPQALSTGAWADARRALERDFNVVGMVSVKRVMDVPARFLDRYVTAMPIHEKLRTKDEPTIHNYLKTNLCNAHAEFVRRADIPELVEVLTGPR